MGDISKFTSAEKLLSELTECDIVEFNRVYYSHYALYIGNGICVHVEAPAGGKKGRKYAQLLTIIAGQSPCRIREFSLIVTAANQRSKSETIALANYSITLNPCTQFAEFCYE